MHLLWCCEKNYKLKQLLNYASKLQLAAIIHGVTASVRWPLEHSSLPFTPPYSASSTYMYKQ